MTGDETETLVMRGIEIAPHPLCIPMALEWKRACHRWAWAVFGLQDERQLHYTRAERYYYISCIAQWMHRHHLSSAGRLEFSKIIRERDMRRERLHPTHYEVCKQTFQLLMKDTKNDG